MSMFDKGVISALKDGGARAEIMPSRSTVSVTAPLVVPEFLFGMLQVNDPVVFAMFDDNTGVILSRLDGKWSHKIEGNLEVTGETTVGGNVTAADAKTANGISLQSHRHGYTHGGESSGADTTTAPK